MGGLGKNIPVKTISKEKLSKGLNIIELIFQNGLVSSKSEVRRILKNNGIRVNDNVINNEKKIINMENVSKDNSIKLSIGKKNHLKVKII